jgi:gas vesicle protein
MEQDREGYSGGTMAFAFLAGAIIGAGAALLLAPQAGIQTRTMLKDYAERAEEEVRDKVREAKSTLDSAIEQGKQFITEKKSVLTAAFEAGREAMKKERS